jgi:branched-chain amino acid transport system permease protein
MGQVIVYGIILGAIYGLIAVGLALTLGVMKYLNIAHGSFIILGGYISFWLFTLWHVDPFLSVPFVMVIMFLMGLLLYKALFSFLAKLTEGDKFDKSMLVTFGLIWVLDNVATLLWTSDVRCITTHYTGNAFNLIGVRIPYVSLGGIGLAFMSIFALHLFLTKTYLGKSVRATAQDWEAASLMGVNLDRTQLISCGLGISLAGLAGAFVAVGYSIAPNDGLDWLLKAFIIVVLAGFGSIDGVFAAGLLLGLVESISVYFVGPSYREVVGIVIFIVVLMLRPQGLFVRVGMKI